MTTTPIPAGRGFVTAQQVADRAGVSRSAVSRTFTPGGRVSETTRAKVLAAAESLGYHVNHLARGLIRERSGIVCLIAASIATPFQSAILDAVTRRLQDTEKVAMLVNTSGRPGSVERALRQALQYRADASVVLSGTPDASLVAMCLASGQQVVLVNRADDVSGPDYVAVDNVAAARKAVSMLERAHCRRVVVVSSTAGTPSLVERERAFAEAAGPAGIAVDLIRAGPTSYASGAEAARVALAGETPPDGAFCVTDLLACGVMDVARHEFGLSIPDEFSVVGFDDIEEASWSSYALTTFRQPIDEIAAHIVATVAGEKPANGGTAVFEATPVWRKSVRPR